MTDCGKRNGSAAASNAIINSSQIDKSLIDRGEVMG